MSALRVASPLSAKPATAPKRARSGAATSRRPFNSAAPARPLNPADSVGNLRGGNTARDIEARRSRSEFHPWNRDGAVVAEDDIPGEPRRSGKDRGGHFRQQP